MTNIRFDCIHQSSPLLGLLALSDLSLSLVQLQAIHIIYYPHYKNSKTQLVQLQAIQSAPSPEILTRYLLLALIAGLFVAAHLSQFNDEFKSSVLLPESLLFYVQASGLDDAHGCACAFDGIENKQAESRKKCRFPTEEQPWLLAQFSISVGLHLFSLLSLVTCACVHLLLLLCQPHQYQVATLKLIKVSNVAFKASPKYGENFP